MNPWEQLISLLTPNTASAEVIPTDPLAQALIQKIQSSPAYQIAQARPQKAYVSTQPSWLMQLFMNYIRPSVGMYDPMGNSITVKDHNPGTLRHELGHFIDRTSSNPSPAWSQGQGEAIARNWEQMPTAEDIGYQQQRISRDPIIQFLRMITQSQLRR